MASRYAKGMSASGAAATPEELKQRIEAGIPGATAEVTGDGHHFNAVVSAPAFRGQSRIAQHRLVYDVFGPEVGGRIHALSIQTKASETESIA
jgi:stress-induced morphogen